MNNWLQQLTESYKKILRESNDNHPRYWSSSHNWSEIHEPESYEYGSNYHSGDGLQQSQNSGAPTGYLVHAHSGQIVDKHTVKAMAQDEAKAFHKGKHNFETAGHATSEEEGILHKYGVQHEEAPPEEFETDRALRKEVDAAMNLRKNRTPTHPDRDPHLAYFRSLSQSK